MADIKVTGLSAITPPLDNGSLFLTSSYDGVSAYTSEKITLTQLRDEVFLMESEDKLTFDSSGTNKTVISDSTRSYQALDFNTNKTILSNTDFASNYGGYLHIGDGSNLGGNNLIWAEITAYDSNGYHECGFIDDGAGNAEFSVNYSGTVRIKSNATGLGFFNATPVAKPSVTGSRGGNAALADLLTDLASLGLITDSTTA